MTNVIDFDVMPPVRTSIAENEIAPMHASHGDLDILSRGGGIGRTVWVSGDSVHFEGIRAASTTNNQQSDWLCREQK